MKASATAATGALLLLAFFALAETVDLPEEKLTLKDWYSPYEFNYLQMTEITRHGSFVSNERKQAFAGAGMVEAENNYALPSHVYYRVLVKPDGTEELIDQFFFKGDNFSSSARESPPTLCKDTQNTTTNGDYVTRVNKDMRINCPLTHYYNNRSLPALKLKLSVEGLYRVEVRHIEIPAATAKKYFEPLVVYHTLGFNSWKYHQFRDMIDYSRMCFSWDATFNRVVVAPSGREIPAGSAKWRRDAYYYDKSSLSIGYTTVALNEPGTYKVQLKWSCWRGEMRVDIGSFAYTQAGITRLKNATPDTVLDLYDAKPHTTYRRASAGDGLRNSEYWANRCTHTNPLAVPRPEKLVDEYETNADCVSYPQMGVFVHYFCEGPGWMERQSVDSMPSRTSTYNREDRCYIPEVKNRSVKLSSLAKTKKVYSFELKPLHSVYNASVWPPDPVEEDTLECDVSADGPVEIAWYVTTPRPRSPNNNTSPRRNYTWNGTDWRNYTPPEPRIPIVYDVPRKIVKDVLRQGDFRFNDTVRCSARAVIADRRGPEVFSPAVVIGRYTPPAAGAPPSSAASMSGVFLPLAGGSGGEGLPLAAAGLGAAALAAGALLFAGRPDRFALSRSRPPRPPAAPAFAGVTLTVVKDGLTNYARDIGSEVVALEKYFDSRLEDAARWVANGVAMLRERQSRIDAESAAGRANDLVRGPDGKYYLKSTGQFWASGSISPLASTGWKFDGNRKDGNYVTGLSLGRETPGTGWGSAAWKDTAWPEAGIGDHTGWRQSGYGAEGRYAPSSPVVTNDDDDNEDGSGGNDNGDEAGAVGRVDFRFWKMRNGIGEYAPQDTVDAPQEIAEFPVACVDEDAGIVTVIGPGGQLIKTRIELYVASQERLADRFSRAADAYLVNAENLATSSGSVGPLYNAERRAGESFVRRVEEIRAGQRLMRGIGTFIPFVGAGVNGYASYETVKIATGRDDLAIGAGIATAVTSFAIDLSVFGGPLAAIFIWDTTFGFGTAGAVIGREAANATGNSDQAETYDDRATWLSTYSPSGMAMIFIENTAINAAGPVCRPSDSDTPCPSGNCTGGEFPVPVPGQA
jgi:hypothetical protein